MGACIPERVIVVEYLEGGDLESLLHSDKPISMLQRMLWAVHVASGMNWLHQHNPTIIHRDLKSANVLIDRNNVAKVCDFGFAMVKEQDKTSKGTPLWMAPEVLLRQGCTEKSDIYSYGIVLWELVTRDSPFKNVQEFQDLVDLDIRPPLPDNIPDSLTDLINECWAPRPLNRPSFSDIKRRLSYVVIDVAIDDQTGRDFWQERFTDQPIVPWELFKEELEDYMELKPHETLDFAEKRHRLVQLACLKELVETKTSIFHSVITNPGVTVEKFGDILRWFGPMEIPFLTRMSILLNQPWFHGELSTQDAAKELVLEAEGAFLIRFSSSTPGGYALSILWPEGVKHFRIVKYGSSYVIHYHASSDIQAKDYSFPDIPALVMGLGLNTSLAPVCKKFAHLVVIDEVDLGYESQM